MDPKQAFPEQSLGDESEKNMEQPKFLAAHTTLFVFS